MTMKKILNKQNKKMSLQKLGFLLLVISLIISSCKESFLDEEQITAYDTDRFKSQEGLDELVTGAYQKIKWQFNYIWGIQLYNLGVDEFTDGGSTVDDLNGYSTNLNSEEGDCVKPLWTNMYGAIESANTIIEYMPEYYDQDDENYNTRLGEGYFMRGYYYLKLVAQFGGVVLKLEPSTSVETYFTRSSEEECFAQIISDLETAYELLPTEPEATGRITKYAAAHFLAKAHLTRASELYDDWNSDYVSDDLDAVISYATEVYENCPLCDNYQDLWDYQEANGDNESVSEVVLAAQFSDDQTTWGRYGNQMHLYYPAVYQNIAGTVRDISGDREFSYARSTNYTLDVFDRVNDSRFWKSFITAYGCNSTDGAPTWDESTADLAPDTCTTIVDGEYQPRFEGGDMGIQYIVNDAGDTRFEQVNTLATGVSINETNSEGNNTMFPCHTFVRYFNGDDQAYVGEHGNYGYYATHSRYVALSKFRDGYRVSISSQFGTRDGIVARSAEDVLMVAEAYIRKGASYYSNAITWFNYLRDRAAYSEGEDRAVHVDGGQAYENNSYCDGIGGGYSDEGAIYSSENTYYLSNNIDETTASTYSSMHLNSVDDIYNSSVDSPIYDELGCSSDEDKMMCFLLNERTRELCGESYRWETLARTKRLEARYKAFNDGWSNYGTFDADTHYYRPIPQSFLDAITDEDGNALTSDEKADLQNPGY